MWAFVNLWSFIIQFINICVIIFVLNKFLFKPYLIYLKKEEQKREEFEQSHMQMEKLISDAKHEAELVLSNAIKEMDVIRKQWELVAHKEAENLIEKARNEASMIKNKALLDIENERKTLYSDLKNKLLDVALKINQKLFSKSETNIDFIKTAINNEKI